MAAYIDEHESRFKVGPIRRVLSESLDCGFLTPRGYRMFETRPVSRMRAGHEALARDILQIHSDFFVAVYGYGKMHAQLVAQGRDRAGVGRDQVMNIMRELGIRGVRHGHEHAGAAVAGVGAGDLMGRVPWRNGWSYPPQRPWHAVHRHGVHHQGYGIWDAAVDRHRRRLVRQRHGRKRRRRVQDRAGMAAQTLRGSEGPGIGDVPVGLVAGTRSACTGPWATGHRKRWKPSIINIKRHKPPHYKGGTKIRPLQLTKQLEVIHFGSGVGGMRDVRIPPTATALEKGHT